MALYGKQRILGRHPDLPAPEGRERTALKLWKAMINKCHGKGIPIEVRRQASVSSRFKEYRTFFRWYMEQPCSHLDDVCLTKELLQKESRVYSDATCVLLPKQIYEVLQECRITRSDLEALKGEVAMSPSTDPEKRLQEAYIEAKREAEATLRILAEKYRHMLDERAYRALVQYQVEITD